MRRGSLAPVSAPGHFILEYRPAGFFLDVFSRHRGAKRGTAWKSAAGVVREPTARSTSSKSSVRVMRPRELFLEARRGAPLRFGDLDIEALVAFVAAHNDLDGAAAERAVAAARTHAGCAHGGGNGAGVAALPRAPRVPHVLHMRCAPDMPLMSLGAACGRRVLLSTPAR